MQCNEIPTVQGQERAILATGKNEDLVIGDRSTRLFRLQSRHNIVAELAKKFDDLVREVLVGVESRHGSRRLVRLNRSIDLSFICVRVRPRVYEVGGPQRREVRQNTCFGPSLPAVAFQRRDGNTRSNDASCVARNTSDLFDARPNVRKVEGEPLKQLRPFRLAQQGKLSLQIFERHVFCYPPLKS